MAQRLPVLYNKKPCYDIVFQQSFDGLWEELQELGASKSSATCAPYSSSTLESVTMHNFFSEAPSS